jgi:outer membrane protein assembly factor BamE (lipoprotein component of BamABCDE complex)
MEAGESRLLGWKSFMLLGALCLVGAALTVWQLLPLPIAESAAKQVSTGMSKEQVRQALGAPEESHRKNDGTTGWVYYFDYLGVRGCVVSFDQQGAVTSTFLF